MKKWFDALTKEAKKINPEGYKPTERVGPGERIVGQVDKEHRALYALARMYGEKAEGAFDLELRQTLGHAVRMESCEPAAVLRAKAKAVMDVFWASLRGTYDLWGSNVAMRKGWKIVRISIEEVPNKAAPFDFSSTFKPRH